MKIEACNIQNKQHGFKKFYVIVMRPTGGRHAWGNMNSDWQTREDESIHINLWTLNELTTNLTSLEEIRMGNRVKYHQSWTLLPILHLSEPKQSEPWVLHCHYSLRASRCCCAACLSLHMCNNVRRVDACCCCKVDAHCCCKVDARCRCDVCDLLVVAYCLLGCRLSWLVKLLSLKPKLATSRSIFASLWWSRGLSIICTV